VLYQCPHCGTEFSMQVRDKNTICCTACSFEAVSDEYALLHSRHEAGKALRYASDWSRLIFSRVKEALRSGAETGLSAPTAIYMIDEKKGTFAEAGRGTVTLTREHFRLEGEIDGAAVDLKVPIAGIPTLPFTPGKHLEIQHGREIYRCVLEDGRLVMKFINMVKAFYELEHTA